MIAVLIVVLLIGLGWLVVRPATRTIRSQFDELDARVLQRTSELATALGSLQREIQEREEVELKNQRLAAQLSHVERVTTMGHLTAGLAHELNQPLGAITNYTEACEVLLENTQSSGELARVGELILQTKRAALRAGQIVRRMRNFVRPNATIQSQVGVNVLIREIVELCRTETAGAGAELILKLSADDDVVVADSIQIQQVLVNLVQNCAASHGHGECTTRTITIRSTNFDGHVQVDVVDTGPGFVSPAKEACSRRFIRPSRMDLASDCRSVGRSWKTIADGFGLNCKPVAEHRYHLPYPSQPSMSLAIELSPTIFVVDDDDEMRESLAALLDVLGFAVRTFASPSSFSRFYQTEMRGCLVLDIHMPRQTGLELYEQLLREGKRLPVIFITAHADVPTAVAAMKTGALEFLEKPFDRHRLLERVQAAIQLDSEWRERDAAFTRIEERISRLNERDRETLQLILAGESNKSMAAKLLLSERAVEMRRSTIMKKLDVQSLAELLELAVTHRILDELRQAKGRFPKL